MKFIQGKKRLLALLLLASMALGLTGCGLNAGKKALDMLGGMLPEIKAGEMLKGSKWINSDVYGSIDENTPVNIKDDFHTAVNRDWILEQSGNEVSTNSFSGSVELVNERIPQLMETWDDFTVDPRIMSQQDMEHIEELITTMIQLAGDQKMRDEKGVEPLRPYIEAIESIDTLEEMTAYLADTDGMNFRKDAFVTLEVGSGVSSRDENFVHVIPTNALIMESSDIYGCITSYAYKIFGIKREALEYTFGQLGYSVEETRQIIKKAYWLEAGFADELPTTLETQEARYASHADNVLELAELEKLQGSFPLTQILEEAGLSDNTRYLVYETGYIRELGRYYKETNLESMKAWLMVHTALDALPMLDSKCVSYNDTLEAGRNFTEVKDRNYEAEGEGSPDESDESAEDTPDPLDVPDSGSVSEDMDPKDADILMEYLNPYLSEAMQQLYIARYCSADAKEQITRLIDDVIDYYIVMLRDVDWLSAQTIDKAIEKLENMAVWAVYPDELRDFSGLEYSGYDENGNLLDAINAIRGFEYASLSDKAGKTVDRNDWDVTRAPVTTVNAQNMLTNNSMVIFDGILSDGFLFDPNGPVEVNYARLGVVIGHEITHSFDTSGYMFDKDGLENYWWTAEDEVAFRAKSDNLANHYKAMNVSTLATTMYDGDRIAGEVIADMGGVKCMLGLAGEIEDFDYELFFRSYAQLWRIQNTVLDEVNAMQGDPHPLNFLRTNVTLQQFEEFYETFDIGPGDGMYLAPEKRIAVW